MKILVPTILAISSLLGTSIACNKTPPPANNGWGWGQPQQYIAFPKPTLFPKIKQAYLEGKRSVDYHKIVGPSLKPLPYKKGVGFLGAGPQGGYGWPGWNNNNFGINNGIGNNYGVPGPVGIGKSGFVGIKGGDAHGWGKRTVVPVGPIVLPAPVPAYKGQIYGGAIKRPIGGGFKGQVSGGGWKGPALPPTGNRNYIPVTPIAPLVNKFPVPVYHPGPGAISHQTVTIIQKGYPQQPPLNPHAFHGHGKK